jgi:hypothetical protein
MRDGENQSAGMQAFAASFPPDCQIASNYDPIWLPIALQAISHCRALQNLHPPDLC